MYGCKYCKMDMKKKEEYCALTKQPTNGAVMCDFEYEHCPEYQQALKPIKPKRQTAPQLTQMSLFGASGEKPFKG